MARMWFGNETHQQWVPCPRTGMTRTKQGYSEEIEFANGGIWVENSRAWHNAFSMEFPVQDMSDYEGLEAFNRFASGEYGDGYLYFTDVMQADLNLAPLAIANPSLMVGYDGAWKNMLSYDAPALTAWEPTPGLGLPSTAARFTVNWQPDLSATDRKVRFLVPPGYTMWVAATGAATGTGALRWAIDTETYSSSGDLVLEPSTPTFENLGSGQTQGSTFELYLSRSNYANSTVTLNSVTVRVLPDGKTPIFDRFRPGAGCFGMKFRGGAIPEEYIMANRHLVGMSAELVEVEPWGLRG